ncbi:prp1 [[Candida] subhashii]|uniref:Prp1 n=1 Tax=[Candida] subhashii TaxID=561895 RepID=A0A8J5QGV0_9ASCO|nr:prp1 [[Candida] subhashii]KAG7661140.1 prp1 [[Candida] subhashii]
MERKAFLDQEPPPGYIPGIGRGAVGFTTSADSFTRGIVGTINNEDDDDNDNTNAPNNYLDNEGGILLSRKIRDDDDEEAERIYAEIETRLNSTRKQPQDQVATTTSTSTVTTQFNDLKRELATVTEDQWASLPEAGDMTRRNKRMRILEQQQQRTYATPDSIIAGAAAGGSSSTNFKSISESRDKLLSSQLDNLLPTTTTTDTELEKSIMNMTSGRDQDSKIADVRKARLILGSLRKSEPYRPSSWISSARLEEEARNFKQAKEFVKSGCRLIPKSEELWLENIRLHERDVKECRNIVNMALEYLSNSEKIWMRAFELEQRDPVARRRVLMKGLEELPNSATLWRKLIDLEDDQETVKKLFIKAVELCPGEWDFWLGLINISTYQDSKIYLNKARKGGMKGDPRVWIAGCKLEERERGEDMEQGKLNKLMNKAFAEQEQNDDKKWTKGMWFENANTANSEGFGKTAKAIVFGYLDSQKSVDYMVILEDADEMYKSGNKNIGNCLLEYIMNHNPNDIECWKKLIKAARKWLTNDLDTLFKYYEKAIEFNPDYVLFHLMYAKDIWKLKHDIPQARSILYKARGSITKTTKQSFEQINLAIIKLELATHNFDNALKFTTTLTKTHPTDTPKYWYKHIHILRSLNPDSPPLAESKQALTYFPTNTKLHLQHIQILLHDTQQPKVAREAASIAVKQLPDAIPIWLLLAHIDDQYLHTKIRARSVLDTAIQHNPKNDELWVAKIRLEIGAQDLVMARQLVNRGLKQFPQSPGLWVIYLSLIPKMSHRKTGFLDALKKTENSPGDEG